MQRERKNASGLDHVYVLQGLGPPTAHRIRECDSLARPSDEGEASCSVALGTSPCAVHPRHIDVILMQGSCKATELCCLFRNQGTIHPEAQKTRPV